MEAGKKTGGGQGGGGCALFIKEGTSASCARYIVKFTESRAVDLTQWRMK